MFRRGILLLAGLLTCASAGCDALFLHTQFVPLEASSERIWLEKESEEELRAALPVLQRSVKYSDRFYANRLLISDSPDCPAYFARRGFTWDVISLFALADSHRLQGLADFSGRTYAVVREVSRMGLEDVVVHEMTHVYLGDWACDREVEEGFVLAVSLLVEDAYFGALRSNAREVLEDLTDDELRGIATGLGARRPFWRSSKERAKRGYCAFSLVDLVSRRGGLAAVGRLLGRLRGDDESPVGAAAFVLAVSEEQLLQDWLAFLRSDYLDPCDPELWSPGRLWGGGGKIDVRKKRAKKRAGTLRIGSERLGAVALSELLGLGSRAHVVLSEEECWQLLGSAPLSPATHVLLAKIHHDSGRLKMAREAWLAGWELEGCPKERAGRLLSGRFFAKEVGRLAGEPGPSLPEDLRVTRRELAAGWCLLAGCPTLALLLATSEGSKDSAPSLELRVHAAVMRGDVRAARNLASEAMSRFPEQKQFRYYLAWLRFRRDDLGGARELLTDDAHWPEESEWSDLRGELLSRLSVPEASGAVVELEIAPAAP